VGLLLVAATGYCYQYEYHPDNYYDSVVNNDFDHNGYGDEYNFNHAN